MEEQKNHFSQYAVEYFCIAAFIIISVVGIMWWVSSISQNPPPASSFEEGSTPEAERKKESSTQKKISTKEALSPAQIKAREKAAAREATAREAAIHEAPAEVRAFVSNNSSACSLLSGSEYESCLGRMQLKEAIQTANPKACEKISHASYRKTCTQYFNR